MKWQFNATTHSSSSLSPPTPPLHVFFSVLPPAGMPAVGGSRGEWIRGRCLGRGSTATVYLAASTSVQRETFAVKSAELSRSAPLQREEKVMCSLFSPYVVSFFGSDVTTEPDGRVLYNLFMEYVPGGSLAEAIKQHGGLDEHTIKIYTCGILNALAYLHSRGIVHCDVKGHNILVGKDDSASVKLADFGCARWVDDGTDGRGVISGTPLYMAPEVARGEEQGTPADIWALGCTVIEMATGCPPWRDVTDPIAAIHRIAFSGDAPDLPCNVSDDARDFLGRCLSRDPRMRWSAEELLSHPFVKCCVEFPMACVSADSKRNSPKSTLDHGFWDSWQENGEEEEEGEGQAKLHMDNQPLESAQERFRQLVGGGVTPSPATNATWEESCWVTIRNSEGLESTIGESDASTTSSSWLVDLGVDAVGGMERSAGCSDGAVVTTVGCLPHKPSPHFFANDVNIIYSSSVGDRNDLVCKHDLGFLQEITPPNFVMFDCPISSLLLCSCHFLISFLGCLFNLVR